MPKKHMMEYYMKKIMLLLFVLLVEVPVFAATYTVTQDGSGADYSAAAFNALSGDYSDDVFYFSGEFTSQIVPTVYGTSGHPVILDGYQTSDFVNPNEVDDTSGFAYFDGVTDPIKMTSKSYIILQDFRITNWKSSSGGAVIVRGNWANVHMKRLHIYDGLDGCDRGVFVTSTSSGKGFIAENCYIDGVIDTSSVGSGIEFTTTSTQDFVVRNCRFSGCIDSITCDGGPSNGLIEYNYFEDKYAKGEEDHIDLKSATNNIIIRFNRFEDVSGSRGYGAIQVQRGSHHIYICHNYIYNTLSAFFLYGGSSQYSGNDVGPVFIWSNVVRDSHAGVYAIPGDNNTVGSYYLYNNLIVACTGHASYSGMAGWGCLAGKGVGVNNLFLNNYWSCNTSCPKAIYVPSGNTSNITSENSLGYNDSLTAQAYWGSSGAINFESHGTDNIRSDPSLDSNYKPTASSTSIIDQGATLSDSILPDYEGRITINGETYCNNDGGKCDNYLSFSQGLEPTSTDFSTNPPTIVTASQLEDGAYDIGPWVY